MAAALCLATQASAAILIPSALVEDVKSTTAGVEFMDYVGAGQVIKLQPRDVLVLSYLKSCQHETITGGTVHVGAEQQRSRRRQDRPHQGPCDGGKMQLIVRSRRTRAPPPRSGCRSRRHLAGALRPAADDPGQQRPHAA